MTAQLYTLGRLQTNSTVLQIMNIAVNDGVQVTPSAHSGLQVADGVAATGAEAPRITGQAYWGEAHALFGLSPLSITAMNLFLGIESGGVIGNGDRYSMASGATAIGYITGMSVSQDGIAMADFEIVLLSADGTADPLTKTANEAMPAVSQPLRYTVGGLSINGSGIDGVTGISMTTGFSATTRRSDGDFYPTGAVIGGGAHTISIDHTDPVAVRDVLGSRGVDVGSAAVVTLQSINNVTGVVGGTTQTLTIANGYAAPGGMNTEHVGIASHRLTIHAISADGTTPGIVVA